MKSCKECKADLPEGCRCLACEPHPQDDKRSFFTRGEIDEFLDRKHVFATKQEKDTSLAILAACKGYSPECVKACIAAVEARARYEYLAVDCRDTPENIELMAELDADNAIDAAIALLPKSDG